jgi:hypothetical protein
MSGSSILVALNAVARKRLRLPEGGEAAEGPSAGRNASRW